MGFPFSIPPELRTQSCWCFWWSLNHPKKKVLWLLLFLKSVAYFYNLQKLGKGDGIKKNSDDSSHSVSG